MNQIELAKKNKVSPLMKKIASAENVTAEYILKGIKTGNIVIPKNSKHNINNPCGIGKGLLTKVNANVGTSTDKKDIDNEIKKAKIAIKNGAHAIMDLSVGGNLGLLRKELLRISEVPLGTVPIYEIAVKAKKNKTDLLSFTISDILEVLEKQANEGVDFFTIHCGVTRRSLGVAGFRKRVLGVVSRGGAIIASWIYKNKKENPFYEYFDEILSIIKKYDITLSLGDGLRPGSIMDATDKAQIEELKILGELYLRARKENVQVMIEGPGHIPLSEIKKNIMLQKKFCHGAPFYVLGPLVTDVASGYDHINASIGGAIAASLGADFLCYVTAAEHLRHPSPDDVKEGVIASRIAAHAADISKGIKSAIEWDKKMSIARRERNWKKQISLSIDPKKAKEYRLSSLPGNSKVCTMCGQYCSIELNDSCMRV